MRYASEVPIMSRYVRAARILMGYKDYDSEACLFSDWVMYSGGSPLARTELDDLVSMAGSNFQDLVYLEFDDGDVALGPARIGIAKKHRSNGSWVWFDDSRLVLESGAEHALLVPTDPNLRWSFAISSENRLAVRRGRPMRQGFERGRKAADKRLRELAASDRSIPPEPFIACLPDEMIETTVNYFKDRQTTGSVPGT